MLVIKLFTVYAKYLIEFNYLRVSCYLQYYIKGKTMKNLKLLSALTALVLILSFTGCSQKFTHLDREGAITNLDFTKYQKDGFLITPGDYGADYTSVGLFTFTIYAEADFILIKNKHTGHTAKRWKSKQINPQDILDIVYETALQKDANAITHFKIKNIFTPTNDGQRIFNRDTLEVSGLLIKRNNTK